MDVYKSEAPLRNVNGWSFKEAVEDKKEPDLNTTTRYYGRGDRI